MLRNKLTLFLWKMWASFFFTEMEVSRGNLFVWISAIAAFEVSHV